MLQGETETIRIEEPSVEKAEFVVTIGSRREFHQVKRSHPSGKWSLATLRADGLLQTIGDQLADNNDRFAFASGSDARELADLCDAANGAESPEEFARDFLAAEGRKKRFESLLGCWTCDLPTSLERLRRIDIRTIGERDLETLPGWRHSSARSSVPSPRPRPTPRTTPATSIRRWRITVLIDRRRC